MHFNVLVTIALATRALAESLTDAINEFPACSLRCLEDRAKDQGCQLTDSDCIYAGMALGDLCARWQENPSATDVAAATSTLASVVSAAPTATPTKNAAVGMDADVDLVCLAAVVAAVGLA